MATGTVSVEPVLRCPLCRETGRDLVLADASDVKYGVPGVWNYVRCRRCKLIYLDEWPDPIEDAYPTHYLQHEPVTIGSPAATGLRGGIRRLILAQHGYGDPPSRLAATAGAILDKTPYVGRLARYGLLLFPPAPRHLRALDVGCGNGRYMRTLQELGWEVVGVEPDEVSARLAQELTDATIYRSVDHVPEEERQFGIITLNHVLEHVSDPLSLLKDCRRLCSPSGRVGVVVPNWYSLARLVFGRAWSSLEAPRHLVMFTSATLESLLSAAGFEIESIHTSGRYGPLAWEKSWRFWRGRHAPRLLRPLWLLFSVVGSWFGAGEELAAWARPRHMTAEAGNK